METREETEGIHSDIYKATKETGQLESAAEVGCLNMVTVAMYPLGITCAFNTKGEREMRATQQTHNKQET